MHDETRCVSRGPLRFNMSESEKQDLRIWCHYPRCMDPAACAHQAKREVAEKGMAIREGNLVAVSRRPALCVSLYRMCSYTFLLKLGSCVNTEVPCGEENNLRRSSRKQQAAVAGSSRKWQEVAGSSRKWQEAAGGSCRQQQEVAGSGKKWHEVAGSSRKWQEVARSGNGRQQKRKKLTEVAGSGRQRKKWQAAALARSSLWRRN